MEYRRRHYLGRVQTGTSKHISGVGMLTTFADLNLIILDQFLDKLTMV